MEAKQNANTAVKHTANTAVGSASQPVYIDADGNAVVGNSIPSTTSSVTSGSSEVLTSGGAYTNLVKRYSTSSATGSSTTPVYVDSNGTVQSCGNSIANSRFDGQWVSKIETLSTATAVGTYTIDLSSYLPNDNYNYEVLISGHQTSSSSSTANVFVYSTLMGQSSTTDIYYMWSTNSETVYMTNSFIVPIGSDKKLYLVREGAKGSRFVFGALCYRRIGTNV